MTYIALKPKSTTEQRSTTLACAECRYFSDFDDERGRGLCRVFDIVARRHHHKTETCTSSINILEAEAKPAFEVWVTLYSQEIEDDGYGQPVPVDERMVKVFVSRPTRALVSEAIANRDDLQGYEIVDFWQPQFGYEI
jgi:hypothetical protein